MMKYGQVIEHNNKRNIIPENHAENEVGRLVADRFLCFKKALYKVKASGLQLNFSIIQ